MTTVKPVGLVNEEDLPRVNQTVATLGDPNRPAPPTNVYQPPAAPAAPRANFTWGVGPKTAGADMNAASGSTEGWSDAQWAAYDARYGAPAPAAGGPAPAAPGGPASPITTAKDVTGTTATVGGSTAQGAPTTVAQSFQQGLINRLNPGAASVNSPGLQPALQANRLGEQRGFENNRNLLAERAAANGTAGSGGFESQLLGLAQDRAGREGQFAGNAVMQEQDRLDRNQNSALGLSGSMLSGQQGLSQQMDLANLDATLRRQGMDLQGDLGRRDIDLRGRLGEGQLNLGLLSALMNNDQFGRSLGQNSQQFGASLDQNGLLGLLGLM